ncbi:hypothetical protein M6B38_105280 [Iris pallida]|uniref:Uncharacterized protein n=1 Tax=Iris pallida TaxID=29817 RepID=A0AAX6F3Z1_IRIPA|nr:hypothetical protein M6B38_105280 [Iris pallida]
MRFWVASLCGSYWSCPMRPKRRPSDSYGSGMNAVQQEYTAQLTTRVPPPQLATGVMASFNALTRLDSCL